jgi:hypothetical protein
MSATGKWSSAVAWAAATAAVLVSTGACSQDDLQGAKAEVQETNIALDLPAVPEFELPKPNADGTHSVEEMRLKGREFLDKEVQVTGYVVWKYDCATALRTPDMSDKELKRILREEPERCEIPNLYLGDKADSPPERGIWVVEVPRPPRPDEKKNLPREMLRDWPEVPEYAVGDHVVLTGTWALRSPKGATNSEGLLVYKDLEHLDGGEE